MKDILREAYDMCYKYSDAGILASYIPELTNVRKNQLGISVVSGDKTESVGDFKSSFTIQSIIKPFILMLALKDKGIDCIYDTVGVEATGKPFDAFNYSDQALEKENINPMINAGAITLCTLIDGRDYNEKFTRLLDLVRKISNNPCMDINKDVYHSEKMTGNKNRALAYMLKAYKLISGEIEDILDLYFKACSIEVNCVDIANMGSFLARIGTHNNLGIDEDIIRYINAVLSTSGMYDGSGKFAIKVGVPAKSGVGGGIMAVVPNRMGIGIFSPGLDSKGNSYAGTKALEYINEKITLSIY